MDESTYREKAFNQGIYLTGDPNRASWNGGICHLFALQWCKEVLAAPGGSASTRVDACDKKLKQVGTLYKAFSDKWALDADDGYAADGGVAKMIGVEIGKITDTKQQSVMVTEVTKARDQAFILSFWWSDGSGHSIGVYHTKGGTFSSGKVLVFEPNYGEYKMKNNQFGAWFSWLIQNYGAGAVTDLQLRAVSTYTQPVVAMGVKV